MFPKERANRGRGSYKLGWKLYIKLELCRTLEQSQHYTRHGYLPRRATGWVTLRVSDATVGLHEKTIPLELLGALYRIQETTRKI